MDISAHAISLADKPRTGCLGHQCSHTPGRPILHRRLLLSQTFNMTRNLGGAFGTALLATLITIENCP
jgi:hypothetical protein